MKNNYLIVFLLLVILGLGYFVLKNVTMDMDIVKTETFGPTLCFVEVESVEKAIQVINNSTYGLQASIFTSDEGTAIAIGRKLDVGTVQVNSKPQRGPDHFPFLGVKGSGVGIQGIRYTLDSMMRPRPIVLNKPG
jgi:glyceraldehyde-3-phosphate dehydrogenase (NADP+)